jgi:hypothetical protein
MDILHKLFNSVCSFQLTKQALNKATMRVLADIYIARDDEAVLYDRTPDIFADRAECKGITPLELSMLWAIMRGIEWDVALMNEFPCILQQDGGQRFIHRLPAAMGTELAQLAPDPISVLAPKWAAIEELGWPPDAIRPVIGDLVSLARRAGESGRSVYLWNLVGLPRRASESSRSVYLWN